MTKELMRSQATETAARFNPGTLRPISWGDRQTQLGINKAGVIPYLRGEGGKRCFYLMRPCSKNHSHEEPSKLQICKGTREVFNGDEWENFFPGPGKKYDRDTLEPMLVTALREGIEEVGLRMDNITDIQEWGRATFLSATKAVPKSMWLFLAQVKDREAFDLPDAEHADTVERQWVSLPEDKDMVRKDHLEILQAIENALGR